MFSLKIPTFTWIAALENSGVDFSGKSLNLYSAQDAQPIVDAINACPNLQYLNLSGNTLGVTAAEAIATALAQHPELKIVRFSNMFTEEIPAALSVLLDGMKAAGARLLVLDLNDNAFGPIGAPVLFNLMKSELCRELKEMGVKNTGLGTTGLNMLATALSDHPCRMKIFT